MTKPTDPLLRQILTDTKAIAVVGLSANPVRASYFAGRYLSTRDKRVIGVNPGLAGQTLFGETVYAHLKDIPANIPVDMVDIFRRSEYVPPIVDEAIANLPHLRTIWMQIGVQNPKARAQAEAAGLSVVENLCPKQEHQRLFGELRKSGFATGVISSKL